MVSWVFNWPGEIRYHICLYLIFGDEDEGLIAVVPKKEDGSLWIWHKSLAEASYKQLALNKFYMHIICLLKFIYNKLLSRIICKI